MSAAIAAVVVTIAATAKEAAQERLRCFELVVVI
jgi:hypothetical protein